MNELREFFYKFFDTADFPARWYCGKWSDFHGWLYIISELLIWSAYMAIPILILHYINKKRVAFNSLFLLFAAFILACGFTHLLDAVIFWIPVYRVSALARFVTGLVSWATVFGIFKVLPTAFSMRSNEEYISEITQKKAAEKELNKSNFLLNKAEHIAKMGYWEWNPQTQKVDGSEVFYQIFGLPPQKDFYEIADFKAKIIPTDHLLLQEALDTVSKTGALEATYFRILDKNENVRYLMVQCEKNDYETPSIIGTVQDVTQLKEMEGKLLLRSKQLENRVDDLQQFAYITSHDLKEPLRKISLFSSKLERDYKEVLPDRGNQYLHKITSNAEQQLRLIDEILELASLSNPAQINFETVNLLTFVRDMLGEMELQLDNVLVQVQIDSDVSCPIIKTQMKLVLRNLLSNAIKFKHPDRPVVIMIKAQKLSPKDLDKHPIWEQSNSSTFRKPEFLNKSYCLIAIKDNGIGIEEKYQEQIFEIFRRLHSKAVEGTGLGLALCKRVMENHYGEIFVHSTLGVGSTFYILIPESK